MVEIFFLVLLTRRIDEICATRRRAARGYRVLLILLWFAGEIAGAILGAIVTASKGGVSSTYGAVIVYGAALIGAAVGTVLCFSVINGLAVKTDG